ncbi:PGAP1-like protein [Terracoccus luteus]|uniref:PGAP1-like protein n=1 Tax=Terracoccus luteus TaxID=53356 RepID=A0A495XZF4_9MICO|nr:lipase [Terracoccus luteus]RKT78254.1 PGAP1-like protein [Terracoccus luteus]
MLGHLAPARRRLVVGVVALLVAALVAIVVAVAVNASRGGTTGPTGPTGVAAVPTSDRVVPGPVLLLPGYGGSRQSVEPLARSLRAEGKDVTVVALPDDALDDLEQQAVALGRAVDAVRSRTAAATVDLVGYSAGGVVARLWTVGEGAGRVRRLVTLGTPHHGTDLAALGALVGGDSCGVACRQLVPDSPLLTRLDREPLPEGTVLVSLWSNADEVVVPPSTAVVDGADSPSLQSICPSSRVRHGGLPADRQVQGMVAGALGAGPVPDWRPVDCARLRAA